MLFLMMRIAALVAVAEVGRVVAGGDVLIVECQFEAGRRAAAVVIEHWCL